ncbi:uncharacterized protein LOC119276140 isoform X1 [Triticum dicoccoides]|uniref:uncharacterized protein LOC119276140 isoform X1 n=1 Tax=Triticum dicoccoides TaxID=85692 RepID=UPI00188E86CF|nr:uncharacterized protein LOC119276140 isoform X1 [Triticum dicoccoides]XP_044344631.1 uncharacterized protein LOC123065411 isoform X2 [Triticum aestivum]
MDVLALDLGDGGVDVERHPSGRSGAVPERRIWSNVVVLTVPCPATPRRRRRGVAASSCREGARPGEEGSGEGPEDLGSLLLDLDLGPGTAAAACSFWETRILLGAPGSLLLKTPLEGTWAWERGGEAGAGGRVMAWRRISNPRMEEEDDGDTDSY